MLGWLDSSSCQTPGFPCGKARPHTLRCLGCKEGVPYPKSSRRLKQTRWSSGCLALFWKQHKQLSRLCQFFRESPLDWSLREMFSFLWNPLWAGLCGSSFFFREPSLGWSFREFLRGPKNKSLGVPSPFFPGILLSRKPPEECGNNPQIHTGVQSGIPKISHPECGFARERINPTFLFTTEAVQTTIPLQIYWTITHPM